MEDFSIRAIVIGVSLFITMLTLSAILIYFNTARSIADEVNKRTDIANSYDYIMNSDEFSDELSGVEVRSLINKYAGSKDVTINLAVVGNNYNNVNNEWLQILNDNASIISEEKLNIVNPVQNYNVDKEEKQGKITLTISQFVEN